MLEVAKRFKCQIWSLAKTLAWLTKFKANCEQFKKAKRPLSKSQSAGSLPAQRQLLEPCIKLENILASNRPVFSELKQWPALNFEGRPGSSPFSTSTAPKQKSKSIHKRLDLHRDTLKRKRSSPDKANEKKKLSGYCEICNKSYTDLEQHLESESHMKIVGKQCNWVDVDCFAETLVLNK